MNEVQPLRLPIRVPLVTGLVALLVVLSAMLVITVQRIVTFSDGLKNALREVEDTNTIVSGISAILLKQYSLSQHYHLLGIPESKKEFLELSFSVY